MPTASLLSLMIRRNEKIKGSVSSITGIALNKNTLSLTAGGTEQLSVTITPSTATYSTALWSSSDTSVATVNSSGLVTAVGAGTATITLLIDGTFSATCSTTVTAAATSVFTLANSYITSGFSSSTYKFNITWTKSSIICNGQPTYNGTGGKSLACTTDNYWIITGTQTSSYSGVKALSTTTSKIYAYWPATMQGATPSPVCTDYTKFHSGSSYSSSVSITSDCKCVSDGTDYWTLPSNTYTMRNFEGTYASNINGTYTQVANTYKNGYPVFYCSANSMYMYYLTSNYESYWVIDDTTSSLYFYYTYCYWYGTYETDHYEPTESSASNFYYDNYYHSGSNRKCVAGAGSSSMTVTCTGVTGGQWSLDNGTTWNNSGATVSGLFSGDSYTVKFKAVKYNNKTYVCSNMTGTVSAGSNSLTATYTEVVPDGKSIDTAYKFDDIVDTTHNVNGYVTLQLSNSTGQSIVYVEFDYDGTSDKIIGIEDNTTYDAYIWLYNTNGSQITSDDDTGTTHNGVSLESHISLYGRSAGTYIAGITIYSNRSGGTNSFSGLRMYYNGKTLSLGTISLSASSTSVSGTQNTAISNITLTGTASNGNTVSFSASGLPAGISLNDSTISGTPTGSGSSTATITATASGCSNATLTITFTIEAAGGSSSTDYPNTWYVTGAGDSSYNGLYEKVITGSVQTTTVDGKTYPVYSNGSRYIFATPYKSGSNGKYWTMYTNASQNGDAASCPMCMNMTDRSWCVNDMSYSYDAWKACSIIWDGTAPDTSTFYYTVSNAGTSSCNGNYYLFSGTHGTSSAVYSNGSCYLYSDTNGSNVYWEIYNINGSNLFYYISTNGITGTYQRDTGSLPAPTVAEYSSGSGSDSGDKTYLYTVTGLTGAYANFNGNYYATGENDDENSCPIYTNGTGYFRYSDINDYGYYLYTKNGNGYSVVDGTYGIYSTNPIGTWVHDSYYNYGTMVVTAYSSGGSSSSGDNTITVTNTEGMFPYACGTYVKQSTTYNNASQWKYTNGTDYLIRFDGYEWEIYDVDDYNTLGNANGTASSNPCDLSWNWNFILSNA